MIVLVTGAAGFIGFHLARKLINNGIDVIGFDNLNNYYDVKLKKDRIKILKNDAIKLKTKFYFFKGNLSYYNDLKIIFEKYRPNIIINLAAQAGVRFSIENPSSYIESNLVGFNNILECCRHYPINHLIYASSSSVYGGNTLLPFSEKHSVDHPVSLYAATKKSNELMAHSYSHLFNIPTTGLRFFTVYGPWGRPDMALYLFTKAILSNKPIKVFNHGKMIRDFTYIDDIIESIFLLMNIYPEKNNNFDTNKPDPSGSWAPYRILNIGNSEPIPLMKYINEIELSLDKKALIEYQDMQPGDVAITSADTSLLENLINYKPTTSVKKGVKIFVQWFRDYYCL
tara:strand:+ start:207 stop:1229 length:1023 start_codon:yes stop_codon:yes gene_type:complete